MSKVPFQHQITTLEGGSYAVRGRMVDFERQPVKIVMRPLPDTVEEDEDLYIVETYAGLRLQVPGHELRPHPDAHATNEEAMAHIMQWASSPLVHVFIFDAITKFADKVLADPDAVREAMKDGFVNPQAWLDAAAEAKAGVAAHLNA